MGACQLHTFALSSSLTNLASLLPHTLMQPVCNFENFRYISIRSIILFALLNLVGMLTISPVLAQQGWSKAITAPDNTVQAEGSVTVSEEQTVLSNRAMLPSAALGEGSVPFGPGDDISDGTILGVSVVDLADVNGDGLLDVGVFEGGKHADGGVTFMWYESPDDPSSGTWTEHPLPQPSPFRPFIGAAKFADVDADGDADLVVSMDNHSNAERSAYIYLMENQNGTWNTVTIASDVSVHHINDMSLADMDGDGKLDIIVRSLDPNQLRFYFQDAIDSWEERVIDASPYGATGEGFAVGDIDRQGLPDISIAGHWLEAPANPRSESYNSHGIDLSFKDQNPNVKEDIGDINGDGRNDVIISPAEGFRNGSNHVLAWYEAPPDPTSTDNWTQHVLATDFNGGHTVKLVDIDDDNDLDVVSGVAWNKWGQTRNISIYLNQGGSFAGSPQVIMEDKGLYTGVVGDIGNDGDLDIVGQDTYSNDSHPYFYESFQNNEMPVELVDFKVQWTRNRPHLSWRTLTESNNYGFEVWRKSQGTTNDAKGAFEKIHFTPSQAEGGTAAETHAYRFVDRAVPYGTKRLTYRLIQVDLDGKKTNYESVSVEASAPQKFVLEAAFPNPFRNTTELRYRLHTEASITLEVYNVHGRKVKTLVEGEKHAAGRHQVYLRADDLASGVYFVKLVAGAFTSVERVVVVR